MDQKKHLKKTISAITLGIILLGNASIGHAKETSVTQSTQVKAVKQQVVNLNKSTLEQLVTLKGVGQTRAQSIVVYRQQMGDFKSINELTNISGIGDKIVNDNKARLTL